MSALLRQFSFLILAGFLIFAGLLTGAYAFFSHFHDREYVALNAKTVVQLKPGEYEIFYESVGASNGGAPVAPLFDRVIAMVDDGRSSLDLAKDTSDAYIEKRMKGRPMYRFSVEKKGAYGITLISNTPDLREQVRFAVISDAIHVLMSALKLGGMFFAAAAPFLFADLVMHIRLERRKSVKTRLSVQPWT